MPGGSSAAIVKGGTYIPNQKGKPESPENRIEAIDRKIKSRGEHAQLVTDASNDQSHDRKNRDRQELGLILDSCEGEQRRGKCKREGMSRGHSIAQLLKNAQKTKGYRGQWQRREIG